MRLIEVDSDIAGFRKVHLRAGLNLVIGNRSAKLSNTDTSGHNVGKTSLLYIIEYALFSKRNADYTTGWIRLFEGCKFIISAFYRGNRINLELPIAKRVSIKDPIHCEIKDNAKTIGYFIRHKNDYMDEFSRPNSSKGKDIYWKPFVFGLLGFAEKALEKKLKSDIDYAAVEAVLKAIVSADIKDADKSEITSRLQNESIELREGLKKFDFFQYEKSVFANRITVLTAELSSIKSRMFQLESESTKVSQSLALQKESAFDFNELKKVYEECGVLFANGVVKSFEELVEFNRKLIVSRKDMLVKMNERLTQEIKKLEPEYQRVSSLRSRYYQILNKKDYKEEYDEIQKRLIDVEKEISVLTVPVFKKSKDEFVNKKNGLETERAESANELRLEINGYNEKFEEINRIYQALTNSVLRIQAKICVSENTNSNVNFSIEVRDEDIDLLALKGDAFKRISCGLFDLAITACAGPEYRFIAHDGILDGISAPIKRRYLIAARCICRKYDIQYVLTMINEGIPETLKKSLTAIELNDHPQSSTLFGRRF